MADILDVCVENYEYFLLNITSPSFMLKSIKTLKK